MKVICKDKKGREINRKGKANCKKCDCGHYSILTYSGGFSVFNFKCPYYQGT
jgi:hypothetical protein